MSLAGYRLWDKRPRGPQVKLVGSNEIEWNPSVSVPGFAPESIFFGQGNAAQAMQIASGTASTVPSRTQLKSLYSDRKGKLPISLMLAINHGDQISIFGPDPDAETLTLRAGNAVNFLNAVLAEPEESLSYQRAISIRRSLQTTDISGFTNNGLFASHYIKTSAPSHPSWSKCLEDSKGLVDLRHMQLIEGLGFEVTSTPANTHVLRAKGQDKRVVAVLLDRTESFDGKSPRFQASPVEWGLNIASTQGAPWLIAMRDSQIRLYPAKDGVGVGQKSQVETYFEIDLLTIDEDKAALLPLIFSAEALSENGTADELLRESQKFAAALGTRLRERVYESIVPPLATEIANQLRSKGHELDTAGLQLAYGLTLRVLFRLLFQAYAEDRGLLPAGRNERFDKNSLKDRAKDLIKHGKDFEFGDASSIWFDHMQIWDAIDQGSPEMQIPAYNGGLFGTDEKLHPEGFLIRSLSVPDRVMGPALRALVIDDNTEDGVPGMVDFRSLSVREFGTIYEGLLESSLSVAEQDLTVDKKGAWVPAKKGEEVLAKAGEVYFHSASGERKATGSYYTPSFVVDHLIERSVEPALKNHLAKVKEKLVAGDQAAAYELFFDFRVADLAMGSGHFLVAAIDKIETVMRAFLLERGNSIEGVDAELMRLEEAAKNALGVDEAAYAEIERASLLRRQIARRCIYGLDINPLAVELSRLAIWIHTFVPGLPMSSLEHGLVCANSLTGVGSVEEAMQALLPNRTGKGTSLVADPLEYVIEDALNEARSLLMDAASADEATKAEVKNSRELALKARKATDKVKSIFDVAVGNRNKIVSAGQAVTEDELVALASSKELFEFLGATIPGHLPLLYPEVFLRAASGFDAIIGNPPWEKLFVDDQRWWGRYLPGLRVLNPTQKNMAMRAFRDSRPDLEEEYELAIKSNKLLNSAIANGPFTGIGAAHIDLASAFAWRNWQLLAEGGKLGIVLPRGSVAGSALNKWRQEILTLGNFRSVTFLANSKHWIFEEVHAQYTVALTCVDRAKGSSVSFSGPHFSRKEWEVAKQHEVEISTSEFEAWSETFTFPQLADAKAASVFRKAMEAPRIFSQRSDFEFRPVQGDLNSTTDKGLFTFESTGKEDMEVWGGASFNIWSKENVPFAVAESKSIRNHLAKKLASSSSRPASAFYGLKFDSSHLPMDKSRIAFRLISHSTNRRTLIASLVPNGIPLVHSAPYLLKRAGTALAEAYLLGVMCSIPFDWLVRRWVELNVTFELLGNLPVPKFSNQDKAPKRIIELVGSLVSTTSNSSSWVDELKLLGTKLANIESEEDSLAEIDALVAVLYGFSEDQVEHIFEGFHRGWDFSTRLEKVRHFMKEWS
jgi:hypothetical protein